MEPERERSTFVYPRNSFDPKELATFVQLDPYTEAFVDLELTDEEQRQFEIALMIDPTAAEVIEGTGGVREFPFSTPGIGKGSLQLCGFYAYFPEHEKIVLIDLAEEEEVDVDEMSVEERNKLAALFEEVQEYLDG